MSGGLPQRVSPASVREDISERDLMIKSLLDALHTFGLRDTREAMLMELLCCARCGAYIVPDDIQMSAWVRCAGKLDNGPVCLACVTECSVERCPGCRDWRLDGAECCDAETIAEERAI